MEGVLITDDTGRRILSTYFAHPALAALALDAVTTTREAISWIGDVGAQFVRLGESTSDDEDEIQQQPWASGSQHIGGQAVVQVARNGLRYVAPVSRNVDPIVPLAFLHQLHLVLESYVGGAVTEANLKDNFDVVLELLEEMLASGRPVLSQASQLRELVVPLSQLTKVAATVGIPVAAPNLGANLLLTSPIPWRRSGLAYSSNEIYFDVTETLKFILDKSGKAITGTVTGRIECRARLSGMPDLLLSFTDARELEDCAFHACVRYSKWTKEKIVSFVPPDGAFTLMSFRLPSPTKSLSAIALLPLTLKPSFTQGALGGTFTLTLISRAPPSRPITNIVIRFSLDKSATGVNASIQGGGTEPGGSGGGRWEYDTTKREGIWRLDRLVSVDRPAVLTGQFLSAEGARDVPAVSLSFDSPQSGFSGLRIAGLKVVGENYSIFKGVRLRGEGQVEVRCVD